ncbi:MAG: MmgE/PrpD family protein [Pseudomonadota bacterium]
MTSALLKNDPDTAALSPLPVTRLIARHAVNASYGLLPEHVRVQALRSFVNWMGCALGGCREPAVSMAVAAATQLGGMPQASIVGHVLRTDMATAAFTNCISSSVMAFDDAHLATVTHPSGPVIAALLAYSETRPVSGEDFLCALALGMEITCRLSNVLLTPPAKSNLGFYVTGLTAPVGVAAALGRLMRLDEQRMNWAIGLAASQSSGFRSTHGTMTAHFRPGHAARSGVWAAVLAEKGFTGDDCSLEAEKGFFDVYAVGADTRHAVEGLGSHFEIMMNAFKPYPCGIVIHPTLDACLDISQQLPAGAEFASVTLRVHPLAISMTGIRHPANPLESHVSIYHWAAAALVRGSAGLPEMREDCIAEIPVASLREKIVAIADLQIGRGQAVVEVSLADGRTYCSRTDVPTGSAQRPMTDAELDAKFFGQTDWLGAERASDLLAACRKLAETRDVGKLVFGTRPWLRSSGPDRSDGGECQAAAV